MLNLSDIVHAFRMASIGLSSTILFCFILFCFLVFVFIITDKMEAKVKFDILILTNLNYNMPRTGNSHIPIRFCCAL